MPENAKTPEIRFAGFADAWEQRRLDKLFDPIPNNTLSRADLNNKSGKIKNPIHDGDVDRPEDKNFAGKCYFNVKSTRQVGIVDAKVQDIIDEEDVYSGAWYRAQVRAFAYENSGNKGVAFGLQNVQKLRDDEPLGAGRVPANKAFEAVDEPAAGSASKTASSIFV